MKSSLTKMLMASLVLASSPAIAQQYPNKPVTMIIPFSAGASNDIFGRYVADGLSKLWKQSVLVENRAGAGGAIGAAFSVWHQLGNRKRWHMDHAYWGPAASAAAIAQLLFVQMQMCHFRCPLCGKTRTSPKALKWSNLSIAFKFWRESG